MIFHRVRLLIRAYELERNATVMMMMMTGDREVVTVGCDSEC